MIFHARRIICLLTNETSRKYLGLLIWRLCIST